ncbi:MAG: glucose-6-phosphate dehydrogenase [Gammaproteobacteria bacterium]
MDIKTRVIEPCDLVIFGGSGDLAMRKLLPALFRRFGDGQIPEGSRIIGVARDPQPPAEYRNTVRDALLRAIPDADVNLLVRFLEQLRYHALDARSDDGWTEFAAECTDPDQRMQMFYLSTSPDLYVDLCRRLRSHSLNRPNSRVVIEKPIGRDLASAMQINAAVGEVFKEEQIFRIDHYLGKETVQNLMVLRFANALFEPLWNAANIDCVQITVAETIGVGKRGAYYDATGALRDMVQNHLLQLLCMVAMEPPASLAPDAVRDEKLKVLHALRPIDAENVERLTVRGQYRPGVSAGHEALGYLQELDEPASDTETFVAIKAELKNWRWAGVPFYLRTGKRLPEQVSEIVVNFRAIPHSIFNAASSQIAANKLVLRLQPSEGVKLWLMSKYPGPGGLRLRRVPLDMNFADVFRVQQLDAYERLILDVIRGDLTLFMRRDEVEAAWQWIDPIERAWNTTGTAPHPYLAGTWGPQEAEDFIGRDGRVWPENAAV